MAIEPATNGIRAAILAVIVALSVLAIARYGAEAFHTRAPNAVILRIGAPPRFRPPLSHLNLGTNPSPSVR